MRKKIKNKYEGGDLKTCFISHIKVKKQQNLENFHLKYTVMESMKIKQFFFDFGEKKQ